MFPEEADGKAFGAGNCVRLVAGKAWDYCKPADVGQMLFKVILSSAFHVSPLREKGHGSIGLAGVRSLYNY